MQAFQPLFRSPHLQTIAGHYWPRPADQVPLETRLFRTEPGVEVLVESQRPPGKARGEIVMVHGLEGSGQAVYMRSLSHLALRAGYAAHRFNLRTCGGTEHLCQTLYHAGLTSDLRAVLEQLACEGRAPAWLVGYSLGGNIVLKLAGEMADTAPALIRGVCGVSTPLDLALCARRIEEPDNRVYQGRFVRKMLARLSATGRYGPAELQGLRTVFQIDDRITAPSFGFRDAAHYYETQSAIRYLGGIRVPGLLIQARDDTFIPFGVYSRPEVIGNPSLELVATEHGGHVGFLARGTHRFWLDTAIMEWIARREGTNGRDGSSTG